jgi:hypothetical protein
MSTFYNSTNKTQDYVNLTKGAFKLESGETFNTAEICLEKFTAFVKIVKGHEQYAGWTLALYYVIPEPEEGGNTRGVIEITILTPKQEYTVAFRTFCKYALGAESLEPGTFYKFKTWPVGKDLNSDSVGSMIFIEGYDKESALTLEKVAETLEELESRDISLPEVFGELFKNCPAYVSPESLELPTELPNQKGKTKK